MIERMWRTLHDTVRVLVPAVVSLEPQRGQWRPSRAEALLAEAKGDLERAAELPEDRSGVETLRTLSETLNRTLLREDRAEIERLRNERAQERSRRRDRSQDRDFSI